MTITAYQRYADGHGFDSSAASPTVSPDGRNVYLGALGVVRINRNPTTGAIS